ncbi:Bgt-2863 [Blumeria graminis f. sp. tritici]|uniref:ubiquitinyl hydrolase 1 n=2 Tax=Blumeria graminis f. sp. tritici TaxID=62690 RepID=A0A381L5X3_BLUGR|nr:hypothetical protein BGT96224_2863 [Blumeria graminis f. sp. tritici 96224]VCU39055.1 Bgt-2863 [Blumeria graminis f. sp. tritici]
MSQSWAFQTLVSPCSVAAAWSDAAEFNKPSSAQLIPDTRGSVIASHSNYPNFTDYSIHYNSNSYNTYDNYDHQGYSLLGYQMTISDLEAQAALAMDFLPSLEGPLVGQKKSSHVITEEYAKADPVYVAKTAVLPQMYSHYRPILGDGNCGWRALGFAYFETLLRLQNKARLEAEIARMSSLNNLLITSGGFESWLFEDMAMETTNLLRDLADYVELDMRKAQNILLERFNNNEVSNSIIYHFRLLTSSWLKANPAMYEGFILDGNGVDAYRKNYIEPVNLEIEHLIMCLLIDVLLKPIGIAVEIVYLDRTPGTQANTHLFQPEDPAGVPTNPEGPVIHLLFRPSHYDILYREQSVPSALLTTPTHVTDIQANRAFTQQHVAQNVISSPIEDTSLDTSLLSCLPGFSMPSELQCRHLNTYPSPPERTYNNVPVGISPLSPDPSTQQFSVEFPSYPMQLPLTTPPTLHSPITTPLPPQVPLSADNSSSYTSPTFPFSPKLPSRSSMSSFRPSKYEWAAACDRKEGGHVAFQSPTFKNSHYNAAHYNNVNFQPEQWVPDADEASTVWRRSCS